MLSVFTIIAAVKTHIAVDKPKSENACFDLRYVKTEKYNETMTQDGEGYFVAFRPYVDEKEGEIQLLKWGDMIFNDNYRVAFGYEKDKTTDALLLYFVVENKQYEPITFDLGVFADASFQNNDRTIVKLSDDKRAIIIENPDYFTSHLLLVKGTYYPDVSSIYFGDLPNSHDIDPKFYPYFKDDTTTTTKSQDSVYAFSWKKQTIKAKEEQVYGFIANPGKTLKMPPFIFDVTERKKSYPQNTDVDVKFNVVDHDAGELITIVVSIDGQEYKETFTTTENKKSNVFTFKANLHDNLKIKYKAYAYDAAGYKSRELVDYMVADGADFPDIIVKQKPKKEYDVNDIIIIKGDIKDEKQVNFVYKFDNGPEYENQQIIVQNNRVQEFTSKIAIPEYLKPGKNHTLYIWCYDNLDQYSPTYFYKFFLKQPNEPHIYFAFLSDPRAQKEDQIVIALEALDADNGQNVKVLASWDGKNKKDIGNFTSTGLKAPYAFFYYIPEDATPGRHTITVELIDEKQVKSIETQDLYVVIYDPENPIKSRPGSINEVPLTRNTNACFNLKYTDADGKTHGMSYKDEGFYVGYRIYDGFWAGQTKLIKSKDGQKAQDGDITIKYHSRNDQLTNFFEALFDVTNDGYFPKYIDLGVFVDSEFDNRHDSVTLRADGRGFTVSNDDPYIHYTVFTRAFGVFPNVNTTYLREVERVNGQEISIEKIPFWSSEDDKESIGNTMYSFAWIRFRIPPGEMVQFGATFVPNDVMKTPPTVRELTEKFDFYRKDVDVLLQFSLIDADVGETVNIAALLNQTINEVTLPTMQIKIANPNGEKFNFTVNTKDGPYFKYTVYAYDAENYFSNVIEGNLPITKRPKMTIDDLYIKYNYFEGDNITLSGEVFDESNVYIKYQFDDGKVETAGKVDASKSSLWNWTPFEFIVPIPPQVKPGSHMLNIWAQDEYGVADTFVDPYHINLKPYNPPVLHKAGFSKKVVTAGEKVLMYVAFTDPDVGKAVNVMINIPPKKNFDYVQSIVQPKDRKPFAFYWTVPSTLSAGTYDVQIMIDDHDHLKSNVITNTLLVKEQA